MLDVSVLSCGSDSSTMLLDSLSERLAQGAKDARCVRALQAQLGCLRKDKQEAAIKNSRHSQQASQSIERAQSQARQALLVQQATDEKLRHQQAQHGKLTLELRGKLARADEQVRQLQEEAKVCHTFFQLVPLLLTCISSTRMSCWCEQEERLCVLLPWVHSVR